MQSLMQYTSSSSSSNNNRMLDFKIGAFHIISFLLLIGSIDGNLNTVEGAQMSLINSNQQAFSEYNPTQHHLLEIEPNNELIDSQQQQKQQQDQIERVLGMPRRYLFAGSANFLDLDQYGHITRTNQQQQRRIPLNRILESLSYSILPTAAPMTESPSRFGRTYRAETRRPTSDSSRRLQHQQQSDTRVYPIDFSVGVEMPDFVAPKSTGESRWISNWVNRYPGTVRRASKEEALRSPMHLRAAADFDGFKRVENTNRWNNLKGMWGKRADLDVQRQQAQSVLPVSYADNMDTKPSAEKAETDASERDIIKSM